MGKKRVGSKKAGKKAAMRPEAPSLAWDGSPSRLTEAVAVEGERRRDSHDSLAPVSGPLVPDGTTPEPAASMAASETETEAEAPAAATGGAGPSAARKAPVDRPVVVETAAGSRSVKVDEAPRSVVDDDMMRSFFEAAEEKVARAEREAAREIELSLSVTAEAPPPPYVLARRAQFRKWVSGFLGMAGVLALAVCVKSFPRGNTSAVAEPLTQMAASPVVATRLEPAAARPEPAAAQPAAQPAAAQPAAAQPVTQPFAAQPTQPPPSQPAAEPAAPPAAAVATPEAPAAKGAEGRPGEAEAAKTEAPEGAKADSLAAAKAADPEIEKQLARKALKLLESGRNKAAIEASQAAIEADPSDADPYLYWGTALLETGHNAESKKVFRECVQKATRGRKGECAQFSR